jgi:hypothetical protein
MQYCIYDEEDLLAAMQALLVYAIILFFLPASETRKYTFDHSILMTLHQVAHKLAKAGLVLPAERNKICPMWEDWIRITAKCRTILALLCFEWAFSVYNHLPAFHCDEIGFILAPASKLLWHANSRAEWENHYNRWQQQWRSRGAYLMEELMGIPPGVYIDSRAEAWLAETDEFGMMIMALGMLDLNSILIYVFPNCVSECDGERGASIRFMIRP